MPAIVKAQTTKQAKAAYKARGGTSVTEREQRQLARAVELEARAERARGVERRRAESVKKRAEQEKKDRAENKQGRLGSQRRHDRFGFKASQFHLGAFFGKTTTDAARRQQLHGVKREDHWENLGDEDVFAEDGLDDEILLQELDSCVSNTTTSRLLSTSMALETALMPPPPPPPSPPEAVTTLHHARHVFEPVTEDDLNNLWDELDSSSQVAQELDRTDTAVAVGKVSALDSFGSSEFDLTAEDLDELDPPTQSLTRLPSINCHAARPGIHTMSSPKPPIHMEPEPPRPVLPSALALEPSRNCETNKSKAGEVDDLKTFRGASSHIQTNQPCSMALLAAPRSKRSYPFIENAPYARPAGLSPLKTHVPAPHATHKMVNQKLSISSSKVSAPRNDPPSNPPQKNLPKAIRGPFLPASSLYCSPNLGFTFSQLERFVDDDVQLTPAQQG